MFGEVIGALFLALAPVDDELLLFHSISNPIVAHVHGLRSLLLYRFVGNAGCDIVVSDNGGGRLGMPQVLKRCSLRRSFFAIVKQSC